MTLATFVRDEVVIAAGVALLAVTIAAIAWRVRVWLGRARSRGRP